MAKTIHVVAHTHWDREWYFTTSRSKVYLMKELADVLEVLEHDDTFTAFLIDGQASLVDEYLAWRPQDTERVTKAVRERRLCVGPWYTQCDQMVISAESVVRNLYYGITQTRHWGHAMMIGYVPDAFGQGGNMPQIYQAFGISDAVIVRGVSDDMSPKTNFVWRGSDGTEMVTSQMRKGYSIAEFLPSDPVQSDEFWTTICLGEEAGLSATDQVLFPVGFDQAPIRAQLPAIVAQRTMCDPATTYVLDTLEDYVAAVRESADTFVHVDGELLSGKHRRIHRSIYSSRSDIKALNTREQFFVAHVLEPLLTLSYTLGNEYPHEAVETVWKLLFENAAHDSIGSCVADTVNEDIKLRYKQVHDISTSLVELHARLISTAIAGTEDTFTLTCINTLPEIRRDVVIEKLYIPGEDFALVDEAGQVYPYTVLEKRNLTAYVKKQTINLDPSRSLYIPETIYEATVAIETGSIPAFGYAQRTIAVKSLRGTSKLSDTAVPVSSEQPVGARDHLENEYYRICINADGSLCITDKCNGYVYDHQAVLVENGDDGDSFNYSPPRQDQELFATSFTPAVSIQGSDSIEWADISYTMMVPKNLEERSQGGATGSLPLTLTVQLRSGSRTIDIRVQGENCVESHRICILFDADMATTCNYADELFGSICRPNRLDREMAWYERDQRRGVTWNEVPVAIQPTQTFVSLFDNARGIGVFPHGVREYEIVDEKGHEDGRGNLIRLTLLRTYGYMGKENLLYRPGHASGEETIATPDAQLLGSFETSLGFTTFQTGFDQSGIAARAHAYATPLQIYEYASFLNGRLLFSEPEIVGTRAPAFSLFEMQGDLVVSAIKKAEGKSGLILRLFNPLRSCSAGGVLNFSKPIREAWYTDLLENPCEQLSVEQQEINVDPIDPSKFVTLYVELAEDSKR